MANSVGEVANSPSSPAAPTKFGKVVGVFTPTAMRNCSLEAALVLKGFVPPNETGELQALEDMRGEIGDLRRVIMVYSAGGHSLSA